MRSKEASVLEVFSVFLLFGETFHITGHVLTGLNKGPIESSQSGGFLSLKYRIHQLPSFASIEHS